jgi:hypothetical protein
LKGAVHFLDMRDHVPRQFIEDSARIEPLLSTVMRGLDPRIHLLAKRMDRRVKPGDDNRFNMTGKPL